MIASSNFGALMLLQVHDELVFEVPAAEIEPIVELIRHVTERAADLDELLVVEISHGPNWDPRIEFERGSVGRQSDGIS